MKNRQDLLTVSAISAFSFMLAIALHEQLGHGLATIVLGGRIHETNAFYVDPTVGSLTEFRHRLEAAAGPAMNVACGLIALAVYKRLAATSIHFGYFIWHFLTVNFMIASGYFIFSGFSGLGDLGMDKDGVFFQAQSAALLQVVFLVVGFAAYYATIRLSLKRIERLLGGSGQVAVGEYQKIATVAYLSAVAVALVIGAFNPNGIVIVVLSAAASSVFGTSGLLWMMQLKDRKPPESLPQQTITRSWPWVIGGLIFVAAYGALLARSLYFN